MCIRDREVITKGYNSLLGGKWDHVMTMKQGFAAAYFELPALRKVNPVSYTHLPVILLTAKTNIQSKIEGMELGADAYLEKPFSCLLYTSFGCLFF